MTVMRSPGGTSPSARSDRLCHPRLRHGPEPDPRRVRAGGPGRRASASGLVKSFSATALKAALAPTIHDLSSSRPMSTSSAGGSGLCPTGPGDTCALANRQHHHLLADAA